jgi:Zn-dependent alcohol dehydrogenase
VLLRQIINSLANDCPAGYITLTVLHDFVGRMGYPETWRHKADPVSPSVFFPELLDRNNRCCRSKCLLNTIIAVVLVQISMMAQTQKVIRFSQPGPVSTFLSLTNVPIPSAAPHQALIRIHASAINPSDVLNVEGKFQQTTFASHGRVPGRDFAGTVVTGPKQFENNRVWGTGGTNGFVKDGTHAEYIVVEEEALADMGMPEGMTFSQAAACGVGFLTAATMVEKAAPKAGEHVLVLGLWLSTLALLSSD